MADSIPSLRRKLGEALVEIENLRARIKDPEIVTVTERVEVPVEVIKEVIRTVDAPRDVIVIEYVDNPAHIETIRKLQQCLITCQSDLSAARLLLNGSS